MVDSRGSSASIKALMSARTPRPTSAAAEKLCSATKMMTMYATRNPNSVAAGEKEPAALCSKAHKTASPFGQHSEAQPRRVGEAVQREEDDDQVRDQKSELRGRRRKGAGRVVRQGAQDGQHDELSQQAGLQQHLGQQKPRQLPEQLR